MNLNGKTMKKIYYYLICLFAVFILMWGTIDIVSGVLSLTFVSSSVPSYEPSPETGGAPAESDLAPPMIEGFYQRQMILDRIGDSMARIVVAGLVLAFGMWRIKLIEKAGA